VDVLKGEGHMKKRDETKTPTPTAADVTAPGPESSGVIAVAPDDDGIFLEMREPVVRFYKSFAKGMNGVVSTTTTARTADEFFESASRQLWVCLQQCEGDEQFMLQQLLPQMCELWARLKGYKSNVTERRVLIAGEPYPEAHMTELCRAVDPHMPIVGSVIPTAEERKRGG
jgi:hypothetical protein